MSSYNYTWPTSGGRISSYFGDPRDGGSRSHAGVDIAVPVGSEVYTIAPGTVSKTGYTSARGNYITVDHGNGVQSLYEHLSEYAATVGQNVAAGDLIARSGNTGIGTGPHLHYEISVNGRAVDPMTYSFGPYAEAQIGRSHGGSGAAIESADIIIESIKKYWYLIAAGLLVFAVISK